MTISCTELVAFLDQTLEPKRIKDYCPNGLQVEGRARISHIITGVSASQALVDEAIARNADAILVHHGYFWRGENACISGIKKRRLQALLAHDINLLAYHLPLDNHATLGNNAQLAKVLGLTIEGPLDPNDPNLPGLIGELAPPLSGTAFAHKVAHALNRDPLHLNQHSKRMIKKVAWCTGGAQGYLQYAIDAGADAYISGEVSEPTFHLACETDTHYFAAGHHATERYGVKALGEHLAETFGLKVDFIDLDNPV